MYNLAYILKNCSMYAVSTTRCITPWRRPHTENHLKSYSRIDISVQCNLSTFSNRSSFDPKIWYFLNPSIQSIWRLDIRMVPMPSVKDWLYLFLQLFLQTIAKTNIFLPFSSLQYNNRPGWPQILELPQVISTQSMFLCHKMTAWAQNCPY